jgi:hypothetical protein
MPTFTCDSCAFSTPDAAQLNLIRNITQRVDEGGEMPAGECPHCGALCYLESDRARLFVRLIDSLRGVEHGIGVPSALSNGDIAILISDALQIIQPERSDARIAASILADDFAVLGNILGTTDDAGDL